ncbi:glycosyltransferase [Kosakonia sacchari]|uniref:glycosyltransferase n=1 Tax=Kosakonia sacchari TaxID=1158459 RepID=UPI00158560CB|nr:glycosyltransferase [Kosakonia sacchari]MDN2486126.1 glycosyltransferase [Kosakonia sacchari]NUL38649.1 glycosyltransferase [Kosakonia sacchari]
MIKYSFSIIVPVYNTENFLDKCLQSIQKQNYNNFEVILVDDGSTDSSLILCNQYQEKDQRFRVFTKKNEGQGVARNYGLSKAINDFVLYIDSDDFIEENTLQEINAALNDDADVDIVNFLINFVDEDKKVFHQSSNFTSSVMDGDKIFYSAMLDQEILSSPCNKAYKRQFLIANKIKFPPLRKNEDVLYSRAVGFYAKRALFINKVFYHALIRAGSTSRNMTEQNLRDSLDSIVRLKSFLHDQNVYAKYEGVYKAFVARHISYLVVLSAFKIDNYMDFKNRYMLALQSEFGQTMKQSRVMKFLSFKQKIMVLLCRSPFMLHVLARIVTKLSIYNPGR